MADFDIPGHDIVDGISPSEVNFPAPGKRPFSSMSPAILTDDKGEVHFVIGASGGKKITTAVSLVRLSDRSQICMTTSFLKMSSFFERICRHQWYRVYHDLPHWE